MTEKRFKVKRWDKYEAVMCDNGEMIKEERAVDLLNHLHELADGNEEQLLKVMTYLHDNHYEIWEEVNKECYE